MLREVMARAVVREHVPAFTLQDSATWADMELAGYFDQPELGHLPDRRRRVHAEIRIWMPQHAGHFGPVIQPDDNATGRFSNDSKFSPHATT